MKLLANENFPLASVKILRNAGYDIISVGQDFAGILDSEVIELAMNENRTIITFDRDYGELIFKRGYKPLAGVIYLRWENFQPNEPGEYLIELFHSKDIQFESMLTVIGIDHIRQRKYN
jgi:predicted nuclease of predicted toxin-antitoxin system